MATLSFSQSSGSASSNVHGDGNHGIGESVLICSEPTTLHRPAPGSTEHGRVQASDDPAAARSVTATHCLLFQLYCSSIVCLRASGNLVQRSHQGSQVHHTFPRLSFTRLSQLYLRSFVVASISICCGCPLESNHYFQSTQNRAMSWPERCWT